MSFGVTGPVEGTVELAMAHSGSFFLIFCPMF